VFEAEPEVFQVRINFGDAVELAGAGTAKDDAVRSAVDGGRYVLADAVTSGPAMFDIARLDRAGGVEGTDRDLVAELGRRAADVGLRAASLDRGVLRRGIAVGGGGDCTLTPSTCAGGPERPGGAESHGTMKATETLSRGFG
jgi:hypothetical protein